MGQSAITAEFIALVRHGEPIGRNVGYAQDGKYIVTDEGLSEKGIGQIGQVASFLRDKNFPAPIKLFYPNIKSINRTPWTAGILVQNLKLREENVMEFNLLREEGRGTDILKEAQDNKLFEGIKTVILVTHRGPFRDLSEIFFSEAMHQNNSEEGCAVIFKRGEDGVYLLESLFHPK